MKQSSQNDANTRALGTVTTRERAGPVHATCLRSKELINRHTYAYGIWEGIGVCIGVPAKRGNSEHNGHSQKRR